ncbi:MAG: hypothetical protein NZ703_12820 [Gemmataceae bacterium]|nr:hypothetical protein [Gemmataceae bacterium]MCS7271955.1 hypothetical protein [Gemmataceae bacterium]MDW8243899.1 hypothetical protein [Thermogemmata sp.]
MRPSLTDLSSHSGQDLLPTDTSELTGAEHAGELPDLGVADVRSWKEYGLAFEVGALSPRCIPVTAEAALAARLHAVLLT